MAEHVLFCIFKTASSGLYITDNQLRGPQPGLLPGCRFTVKMTQFIFQFLVEYAKRFQDYSI